MKNIIKFTFLLIMATFTFSCDDFLDKTPLNNLDEKNFWKNETDAIQGVTSVYAALQPSAAFGDYLLNDMYTPIADETAGGEINLGLQTALSGKFRSKWTAFYLGINRANIAIERIPDIQMNSNLKKRLIAECKFLRAFFYFNLIDFYGEVPLYLEEILISKARETGRTPIADVRIAILQDLEEAFPDLEYSYGTADLGRATKAAAKALIGKTYLYAGEFDKAIPHFEDLVTNRTTYKCDLMPIYSDVFDYHNKNNKEVIFDVQYAGPKLNKGSQMDLYHGNLSGNGTGGQNTSCPTVELLDSYLCTDGLPISQSPLYDPDNRYENRDQRLDMTIMRPGSFYKGLEYTYPILPGAYVQGVTRTGLMWRKYVVEDDGSAWADDPQNYIVIRFADILLMYAEAKNEARSTPDKSIYDAFNEVRLRAGVDGVTQNSKSKDEFRQLIRDERKIELAGEGIYYSDIRRWKIAASELNGKTFRNLRDDIYATRVFNEQKHYLWPIPQTERDMNPNLTQNPNY